MMMNLLSMPMAWDLGSFLQNATSIGVVMVVWSVVMIARGLISHGKTQVSWPVAIILLILGGAFMVGGFSFVSNIASGGKQTIEDLGNGTILMLSTLLH